MAGEDEEKYLTESNAAYFDDIAQKGYHEKDENEDDVDDFKSVTGILRVIKGKITRNYIGLVQVGAFCIKLKLF